MSEEIKKLFVIGDKFQEFSNHENTIKISDLENIVNSASKNKLSEKYIIYIGQGVCERRLKNLNTLIIRAGLSDVFCLNFSLLYQKSNSHLTHKKKSKNIMISEPIRKGINDFYSTLMLEDSCAEMSDHVAGQQIHGMVLVEAARQMVMAVTEKYLVNRNRKFKINFVTHSMDTKFYQFVFPLAVSINCKILEIRNIYNNNLSCKVSISFIQNDAISVEITFNFSAMDSKYISEKESYLADQYIKSSLNIPAERV